MKIYDDRKKKIQIYIFFLLSEKKIVKIVNSKEIFQIFLDIWQMFYIHQMQTL